MGWLRYKIVSDYAVGIFDSGTEMVFDICDLEVVSSHGWFVDSCGYPCTNIERKPVRLHRILLPSVPGGLVVDHINRNKLDNRRGNLRVVTQKQNCLNASLKPSNKSGVSGVFFDKRAHRWRAQIYPGGKTIHLGTYECFADAVRVRREAEEKYYGGDYGVRNLSE